MSELVTTRFSETLGCVCCPHTLAHVCTHISDLPLLPLQTQRPSLGGMSLTLSSKPLVWFSVRGGGRASWYTAIIAQPYGAHLHPISMVWFGAASLEAEAGLKRPELGKCAWSVCAEAFDL